MIISSCSTKFELQKLETTLSWYDIKHLPTQKDYPESDAVILVDQTDNQVIAERSGLYILETHHVVKKLLRNISGEATVNVYVREDEELLNIKARTTRPDGSIVDLQPNDFYTLSGIAGSSVIYANVKTIRFTFPAAEKDCIVEYKFQKKNNRPFVHDVWHIQNDLPTLRNQYTLSMPRIMIELIPYHYKAYPQAMEMSPMVVYNNERYGSMFTDPVSFIWARGDIPAFKQEEMMPPPESYRAQLRFALSTWDGWNGIAEWYCQNFFKSQLVVSDSVKALAQRLTAKSSDDTEKIKNIYNYVQKIRYVAVQLGESGLRPSKPQEILRNNYGDCKDKSILCIALLKSIGITSYPVLVLTKNTGQFDPNFTSWNFNHMIVKTSDKEKKYWMDPTSEFSPFNSLPWEDQNIPVLTLTSDSTGVIETTPGSLSKYNQTDINLSIDVTREGNALFHATIKTIGEEARYYRTMLEEKSYTELKETCKKMIINEAAQANIDTITMMNMKELDSSFVLEMTFSIPNAIQQQGNISFFAVNVFKMVNDLRWTVKETRKYPIWYPYGSVITKQTVIRFNDPALVVKPLPGTMSIQGGSLFYDAAYEEKSKNTVVINEKIHINRSEIAPAQYQMVKGFYERVRLNNEKAIVLEKK